MRINVVKMFSGLCFVLEEVKMIDFGKLRRHVVISSVTIKYCLSSKSQICFILAGVRI